MLCRTLMTFIWGFTSDFLTRRARSKLLKTVHPVRCIAVYITKVMWLKGQHNASQSQKPTVRFGTRTCLTSRLSNVPNLVMVLIIKDTPLLNYFLRLAVSFLPRGDCQSVTKKIKDVFCEGFTSKCNLKPLHAGVLLMSVFWALS